MQPPQQDPPQQDVPEQDAPEQPELAERVEAFNRQRREADEASARYEARRSRQTKLLALVAVLALALAATLVTYKIVGRSKASKVEITTASGLKYTDEVVGTGATPQKGQTVTVHYVGMLADGRKFDSSIDRGNPVNFRIGVGQLIRGWDEGIMTMKVGGKRRLVIPPELGYGLMGKPPRIPGNATLIFDVELLGVK